MFHKMRLSGLSKGKIAIFFMLLAALLLWRQLASVSASEQEEPVFMKGEEVLFENFEDEVSPAFMPSSSFTIVETGGSRSLLIDSLGAVRTTDLLPGNYGEHYMVELDVMQESVNASSNGGFSLAVRADSINQSYRFRYIDVLRYDPATRMQGTAGTSIRDRIAIARADGRFEGWYYGEMLDQELGILNKSNRSFNNKFYTMSLLAAGEHLNGTLTDRDSGAVIGEVSSTRALNDFGTGGALDPLSAGRVFVSAENAKVYIDNMRIHKLYPVARLELAASTGMLGVGEATAFELRAWSTELAYESVLSSFVSLSYDENALEIDEQSGTITGLVPGQHEVTISVLDQLSGELQSYISVIQVIDPLNHQFDSLRVQLDKSYLFREETTEISVWGVTDSGEIALQSGEFSLAFDPGSFAFDELSSTLRALLPGSRIVTVYAGSGANAISEAVELHVSEYYGMRFQLMPNVINVQQSATYSVRGVTSAAGDDVELEAGSYELIYDSGRLQVDEQARSIEGRIGAHAVSAVLDGIRSELSLSIVDIEEGIAFQEDFESGAPDNDYMSIAPDRIVQDTDGNYVYRLSDEISPLFGRGDWDNYVVSGKVKVKNRMIDPDRFNTSFELVARRSAQQPGITGGQGGMPFVYRMASNAADDYMRIGTSPGPQLQLAGEVWHDFSVEASGTQFIFRLGGLTQYYNIENSAFAAGGFMFRAENSEIYLDDLVVEKTMAASPASAVEQLLFAEDQADAVKYDVVKVSQLAALQAFDGNGKPRYATGLDNVAWSLVSGDSVAELFNGQTLRIKPDAVDGDMFVVRAELGGKSADLTVRVIVPAQSEAEYISNRTEIKQYDILMKLQHNYGTGRRLDTGALSFLSFLYGQMALHPMERNYDADVDWLISQTDYEEYIVGRTTSGADFIVTQMVLMRYTLDGLIDVTPSEWARMEQYLQDFHYAEPFELMSENHLLQHFVSGVLVAQLWPEATMWNGLTGAQNFESYKQYIQEWIQFRMERGLGEYDSLSYYGIDLAALSMLHAFIDDYELEQLAYNMLQYMYADMAVDSIEAKIGGAHGRSYVKTKEVFNGMSNYAVDMHFGTSIRQTDENYANMMVQNAPLTKASYRPSELLITMVRDGQKRFNNLERKQVYHLPSDPLVTESLKKYTHVTPNYVMGAVVQQDLPEGLQQIGNKLYSATGTYPSPGTWMALSHQEWSWSLMFAKSMEAVIFSHHPGNASPSDTSSIHNYWSGAYTCWCYKHAQEDNVMLGMYQIPLVSQGVNQAQFIHFWLPKSSFERVDEENGWIFVKHYDAYAAIKPLKDGNLSTAPAYEWTTTGAYADIEVKVQSPQAAFIVETADTYEFAGTFEQFKAAVMANEIGYDANNPSVLEYTGLNGKTLRLEYDTDKRFVDGVETDFDQYKLHDSPYLSGEWLGGTLELRYGGQTETISYLIEPLGEGGDGEGNGGDTGDGEGGEGEGNGGGIGDGEGGGGEGNGGGTGDGEGGVGGSGERPDTLSPPENGVEADVKLEGNIAVVTVTSGTTTGSILLSRLEEHPLQIRFGEFTVDVSKDSLMQWMGRAETVSIEVRTGTAGFSLSDALWRDGEHTKIRPASELIEVLAILHSADGQLLDSSIGSLQITVPYTSVGVDMDLLGAYYYNDLSGQWEYAGGKVDPERGLMRFTQRQPGKYAILEYNKIFADVSDTHWAARTLKLLAAKHIVHGVSESLYNPEGSTTRAEFVALLTRLLNLKPADTTAQFADVHGQWYAGSVNAAVEAGIVTGIAADRFEPERAVTRAELVVMTVRALGLNPVAGAAAPFEDSSEIPAWAIPYVAAAYDAGIVKGRGDGKFAPAALATRAEAAAIIASLLDYADRPL